MGAMTTTGVPDISFGSDELVQRLASLLDTHRAVGDDFAAARPALLANLRTLQSALPAAIAQVEAAAVPECNECRQHKPDVKRTTIAGQSINLCNLCLPKLRAMSPFDA